MRAILLVATLARLLESSLLRMQDERMDSNYAHTLTLGILGWSYSSDTFGTIVGTIPVVIPIGAIA
jgi:hypothetical protein